MAISFVEGRVVAIVCALEGVESEDKVVEGGAREREDVNRPMRRNQTTSGRRISRAMPMNLFRRILVGLGLSARGAIRGGSARSQKEPRGEYSQLQFLLNDSSDAAKSLPPLLVLLRHHHKWLRLRLEGDSALGGHLSALQSSMILHDSLSEHVDEVHIEL